MDRELGPVTALEVDGGRSVPASETAAGADLTFLARGGLLNLAGVAANALAGFVLVVIVTRGLGATAAGIFFESIALFSILGAIAQWGADVGVVRSIPRQLAQGRSLDIVNTIKAGVVPAFLVACLAAGTMYVFAAPLARLLTNGAHGDDLAPALRVLAFFLPLYTAYMVLLAVTRGFGTMLPSTIVDRLGRAIVQTGLVAAAILVGLNSLGIAVAWALPFALGAAAATAWSVRLLRRARAQLDERRDARPLRSVLAEFWRFTAPRGLASVFGVVVLWLDTLLLGALRSPAEAGAYAAATRFLVFGQFIGVAIAQVVGPKLSELLTRGDTDRARSVYATATWWLMGLAWPIYVSMIVLAPSLLTAFGTGYQQSRSVLVILGASMLFATAVGPVDVVLLMAGRSSWNLLNTFIAVIANVGLNLALIPRFGLTGAATAWAVSILLNNLLPLVEVWGLAGLQPFGVGSLVSGGSAVLWFGGVGILATVTLGDGLVTVLVTGILATVGHAATLWHFRDSLHLDALVEALRPNARAVSEP